MWNADVIRPLDNPIAKGGIAVLRGNNRADGCIIKPDGRRAAPPEAHCAPRCVRQLRRPCPKAVKRRDAGGARRTCVMVLRNAGPRRRRPACRNGACCPSLKKLLKQGVRDLRAHLHARMSGTSYGACVLHVAPEALCRRPAGRPYATAT